MKCLNLLCTIFILIFLTLIDLPSEAATFDMTLTVDNGYGLYAGTSSGIVQIGGDKNWVNMETVRHEFAAGDYVYVYAWDWGYAAGFIGEFISHDPGFDSFYTTVQGDWEVMMPATQSLSSSASIPDASVIAAEIAAGIWSSDVYSHSPRTRWSSFSYAAISADPQWIWGEILNDNSSANTPSYLFRHQITAQETTNAPVPEPNTMFLLGIGLLGVAGITRKKL